MWEEVVPWHEDAMEVVIRVFDGSMRVGGAMSVQMRVVGRPSK